MFTKDEYLPNDDELFQDYKSKYMEDKRYKKNKKKKNEKNV